MNSEAVYGPTNPGPGTQAKQKVKRYGSVIRLRPEQEKTYRELHADVWPQILNRLRLSNIKNYSIYLHEIEGTKLLFSYMEYTGENFEKDMQAIAEDPETQRWWEFTDPCQNPLPSDNPGQNWTPMELIFHMS